MEDGEGSGAMARLHGILLARKDAVPPTMRISERVTLGCEMPAIARDDAR